MGSAPILAVEVEMESQERFLNEHCCGGKCWDEDKFSSLSFSQEK